MNRVFALTLTLATAVALMGCSTENSPSTQTTEPLANQWETKGATAPQMASDLEELGICVKTFKEEDGVYGSDSLREFRGSTFIQCNNWGDNAIPDGMTCPAVFYISSPGAQMWDPKRPLNYEDGSSVAIVYTDSFQISMNHANSGMEDGATLASECSGVLEKLNAAVGGAVTKYGDYSYEESDAPSAEKTSLQVEQVEMPNLVGAADGEAKNWLFSNGYKFATTLKSTGFNPKTSCMMSGRNVILGQSIAAGSIVNNDSSTMVWLTVDCEW